MIIISVLLTALGIGAATWKLGELPESISALVYVLPRQGGWRWLWSGWLWAVSLTVGIPLLTAMECSAFQFVGFLTVVCLLFCGGMPLVEHERNTAHNALGIAAGILSQLCVVILNPWWLLLWLLWLAAIMAVVHAEALRRLYDRLEGRGVLLVELQCVMVTCCCLLSSIPCPS